MDKIGKYNSFGKEYTNIVDESISFVVGPSRNGYNVK
jgi:hypothetical protein